MGAERAVWPAPTAAGEMPRAAWARSPAVAVRVIVSPDDVPCADGQPSALRSRGLLTVAHEGVVAPRSRGLLPLAFRVVNSQ